MYDDEEFIQHGDQRQEITDPIIDNSAWTRAKVKVINRAKFINVACSSNGKSTRLMYNDDYIDDNQERKLTLKMLSLLLAIVLILNDMMKVFANVLMYEQ